ncbi:MAG: type IV toxin-antitoxin system AbiEi family antitoxin domain-containing protein [Gammaproteobacteria bacterium]
MKKGLYKTPLKSLLPPGMVATKKWLSAQGLSTHTLDNAVKTKTLLPLCPGVYSQYSRQLCWKGIIASLQRMHSIYDREQPSIHIGGLSALALTTTATAAKFAPHCWLNSPHPISINLYTEHKLPAWPVKLVHKLALPITITTHRVKLLWPSHIMSNRQFLMLDEWQHGLPPVYYSCPEKAILEALIEIPNSLHFEQADKLMRQIPPLLPKRLDELLLACHSIKVKRLFFWLCERQNYSWLSEIDVTRYNLGSGKRVIAQHGKLDKFYSITVPSHMCELHQNMPYSE